MFILEKKLKQNFIKTYCNICQMVFKISKESLKQYLLSNILIIKYTK